MTRIKQLSKLIRARTKSFSKVLWHGMPKPEIPKLQGTEFGGVIVPHLHPWTLFLGVPRSGKSRLTQDLVRQQLLTPDGSLRCRALAFDPKHELAELLLAQGVKREDIIPLDVFDNDGYAFDLASDVTTPLRAQQTAKALFPTTNQGAPFFPEAAWMVGEGVIDVLHRKCPGDWTLNDVLAAMHPARLASVLALTPDGRAAYEAAYHREELGGDILATVFTKLAPFRTIARLAERVPKDRRVSLSQFFSGRPTVWILRWHPEADVAVNALNQLLFQFFVQMLAQRPQIHDDPSQRTYVILDELRFSGFRPEDVVKLIMFTSGAGGFGVITAQDTSGLQAVFGPDHTKEILAACRNIGILALAHEETARWAAERLGQSEGWVESESVSRGADGRRSTSVSWSLQQRPTVLPAEFLHLSPATAHDIPGFFCVPGLPPWFAHVSPDTPLLPQQQPFAARGTEEQDCIPYEDTRIFSLLNGEQKTLRSLDET